MSYERWGKTAHTVPERRDRCVRTVAGIGDSMTKILLVDDSTEGTWVLQRALSEEGYEVAVAHDGNEGLQQAYAFQPDLIVLDVLMPGMDGWETLYYLRKFSNVPVIMLTAIGAEKDKVRGLDLGADDYVTKPFGIQELLARIRATLRRNALPPPDKDRSLRFDDGQLVIDPLARRIIVRGQEVKLTSTEYKLLLFLAYNAGRVLSRDQILAHVWGPGYEKSWNTVKVYIRRLRCKIEPDPSHPRYIQTVRGGGYTLAKI